MKKRTTWYMSILLLSIPVTVSLSWILGGELVKSVPPLTLSVARLLVGTLVLFLGSNIFKTQKDFTTKEKWTWWKDQFLLSLSGRAIYYALTASALVTISSLEALLITTLMPIMCLAVGRVLGTKFRSVWVPLFGASASFCVFLAVATKNSNILQTMHSFQRGHVLMIAGVFAYVIHIIYYSKTVKDKNPANPLFAQFLLGTLMLLPFQINGISFLGTLNSRHMVQFLLYALVCNIVPFVAVHYCLKHYNPFIVSTVAILSPIFGTIFAVGMGQPVPSLSFQILSLLSCAFAFACLKNNSAQLNQMEKVA